MENTAQPDIPTPPRNPANTWGMACHLISLAGYLVPLGSLVGPLVIWLVKKEEFPFVDDQGREAANFNISIIIYSVISGILIFAIVGLVLLPAVLIFHLVMTIIASIQASNGVAYRYPLTIRFIK